MKKNQTPKPTGETKTSREDGRVKMENELCNMRKEMDELKSAMKDKDEENLDGMI